MRIRTIIRSIKNLWHWFPIIWNDRQWDCCYLFELLAFKFKLMEDFYNSKYAVSADTKDIASKVRICRLLCERIYQEDYGSMLDLIYHSDSFDDFLKRLNSGQETITCETIGWTGDRWMKYETYMRDQDVELLCKIIKKHSPSWWD